MAKIPEGSGHLRRSGLVWCVTVDPSDKPPERTEESIDLLVRQSRCTVSRTNIDGSLVGWIECEEYARILQLPLAQSRPGKLRSACAVYAVRKRLAALEEENSRLKKLVADLALDKQILTEALDIAKNL